MVLSCLGKKSERPPPASAQLVCFRALALQLRLRRLSAALRIRPCRLVVEDGTGHCSGHADCTSAYPTLTVRD
jgi:hypothetical protein